MIQQSFDVSLVCDKGIIIQGDSINPDIIFCWNPAPKAAYTCCGGFTFPFFFFNCFGVDLI